MIKKILIANRGEIAIRIAKTCRKMGIKTIGVFSEKDKESLHLDFFDESYSLGLDPLRESYLNINKIIDIAVKSKSDAVHPGYGFLSENYEFARKLKLKEIIFIGPPYQAIKAMGDKIQSKKIARKAGVSCIPGIDKTINNIEEAKKYSKDIGFPLMIKASAGGGGKGMRIARNSKELESLIKLAKEEAKNAFGDDRLFLEKYIELPRHIEIQILGDQKGNIVWIGDRECSIQRRHQKIIEEAPSPFLNDNIRNQMGKEAVLLAKEVGYYSAGTVEFVVDKNKKFYFLEMNTRLQVEHPVTEEVTGIDLVKEMINIANKKQIKIQQKNIKSRGWSFESRLCAENPLKNFLPSAGKISTFRIDSKDIRLDTGYEEGDSVSIYYDSLLAKIISKGKNREEARKKMIIALQNSDIRGIETNIDFLTNIYHRKDFINANINTNFIDDIYKTGFKGSNSSFKEKKIMAMFVLCEKIKYYLGVNTNANTISKKWYVHLETQIFLFHIKKLDKTGTKILCDGEIFDIKNISSQYHSIKKYLINDKIEIAKIIREDSLYKIFYRGNFHEVNIFNSDTHELLDKLPKKNKIKKSNELKSPMPGKVISIKIKKNSRVDIGDALIILDAMKMQNVLKSEAKGYVRDIFVSEGDSVVYDQKLILIDQKT